MCSGHTSRRTDVIAITNENVDKLLKDAAPKKVFSSDGLFSESKKALAEKMLDADMDQDLEPRCKHSAEQLRAAVAVGQPEHRKTESLKAVQR